MDRPGQGPRRLFPVSARTWEEDRCGPPRRAAYQGRLLAQNCRSRAMPRLRNFVLVVGDTFKERSLPMSSDSPSELQSQASRFTTTRWSLVLSSVDGGSDEAKARKHSPSFAVFIGGLSTPSFVDAETDAVVMFDHVKFGVSDYAASKAFFLKALEPLGVSVVSEGPPRYGVELSSKGEASLCLYQTDEKPALLHLAFTAENRQQVEAFYRAAMEAGGKDNGAPGLCSEYHANDYAAFVIGPDGHNIEVVCHEPEA